MNSPLDLDRERVTYLLLINAQLIKKAYGLYVSVLSNPQALLQLLPNARQALQEQHNNLSRRVQSNIAVLSYINDKYHNKAAAAQPNRVQFPLILSPPPDMPELNNHYRKLQDLYPEAVQFVRNKIQQMKFQQENRGFDSSNNSPMVNQSQGNTPSNGGRTPNMMMNQQASNFASGNSFNPQSANMLFQAGFNGQQQSQPIQQPPVAQPSSSISPQQILQMNDGMYSMPNKSMVNMPNGNMNSSMPATNNNNFNLDFF